MAEYRIQDTTLTGIAGQIRTLNGTTGTMKPDAMITGLQSANAEVTEQEALLVEIANTLQGKAIGSGGSSSGKKTVTVTITGDNLGFWSFANENGVATRAEAGTFEILGGAILRRTGSSCRAEVLNGNAILCGGYGTASGGISASDSADYCMIICVEDGTTVSLTKPGGSVVN